MKKNHHNSPIHPKEPTHDDIAVCAYTLWLDQGQPENTHEAIWFEAERQLAAKKN